MELFWFSPMESTRSFLLWGIFAGVLAALFYLVWLRARSARVVKALLDRSCTEEASALSAEALGVSPAALRRAAKGSTGVVSVAADEATGELRGFIPAEKKEKAEYLAGKLQWKWWQTALAALLFYAAMLGAHAVLPYLLDR